MSGKGYLEQPEIHAKAPWRSALLTQPGNFKSRLAEALADPSKTLFGVANGIPSVFVTKVLASTRPDFIWLDVEHSMWDRLALHDAIHAAQHHSEGQSQVIVRVPKHSEVDLTTALDAGASGFVLPHTDNVDDVKRFIKEIYYPPVGQRSFSPWTFTPGISDTSLYPDDSFNMGTSNNHIIIIPQIESVEGVKNVDAIAALPEVSALMFGPGDFMADAGHKLRMSDPPHPVLVDAMTKLGMAAHKHGKALFGAAMTPEQLPMLVQSGYRAIAVMFDMWGMANLAATNMKNAREALPGILENIKASQAAAANGHANGNGKAPETAAEEKEVTLNTKQ
jgi:4-hydroxy-2-oxoheptanedioate aldolase